jgi:hypothetical protein
MSYINSVGFDLQKNNTSFNYPDDNYLVSSNSHYQISEHKFTNGRIDKNIHPPYTKEPNWDFNFRRGPLETTYDKMAKAHFDEENRRAYEDARLAKINIENLSSVNLMANKNILDAIDKKLNNTITQDKIPQAPVYLSKNDNQPSSFTKQIMDGKDNLKPMLKFGELSPRSGSVKSKELFNNKGPSSQDFNKSELEQMNYQQMPRTPDFTTLMTPGPSSKGKDKMPITPPYSQPPQQTSVKDSRDSRQKIEQNKKLMDIIKQGEDSINEGEKRLKELYKQQKIKKGQKASKK